MEPAGQPGDGAIRFLLDGAVVEIPDVDPTATLLDHLRYRLRRTGTKEGCAEGDCGACTVLVGEQAGPGGMPEDGTGITWRAVNSCILFLPMLDGKALMTVESLACGGAPQPLQATMAVNGSSQCGFCTPGFVMSLHGRAIGARGCELPLADTLAGNLCRCTGYGPILDAGEAHPVGSAPRDDSAVAAGLTALHRDRMATGQKHGRRWFAPRDCHELIEILGQHPEARLVAGATDVGLWVTKGLKDIPTVVFLGGIAELRRIEESEAGLTIGAGVTYADAHAALGRLHPDLGELVRRIGGLQVRNMGTIGGNIANGSPIGDGPPALIALGAELVLRGPQGERILPLEEFFLAYGKQDLRSGEFVAEIRIPRPGVDDVVHISKLSRRFDSDISAVCAAFRLTVRDGTILNARVAFGGMAATPRRAAACEAALGGASFTPQTLSLAAAALREDFTPLDDVRGSAAYRLQVAGNLLRRLWHAAQGEAVSVLSLEA